MLEVIVRTGSDERENAGTDKDDERMFNAE